MPEKGKYLAYFSTTKDNSLKNIVILLYFIFPQQRAKTKQENVKTSNTTSKLTKILKLMMPSSEIQARHFIINTNSMVAASTSQTTQMLYKACFVTIVFVVFFGENSSRYFLQCRTFRTRPRNTLRPFFWSKFD